jgi:hypothetical protein
VLTIVRGFPDTDYSLDEMVKEVGTKFIPEAWAKLVQEAGENEALEIFGAYVLELIRYEAFALEFEGEEAASGAMRRLYAGALESYRAGFAPSFAVEAIVRGFPDTDFSLDEMAKEVGTKFTPEAWARLVQEAGEDKALEIFSAYVLEAIPYEAFSLEFEAQQAAAAMRRMYTAALRRAGRRKPAF